MPQTSDLLLSVDRVALLSSFNLTSCDKPQESYTKWEFLDYVQIFIQMIHSLKADYKKMTEQRANLMQAIGETTPSLNSSRLQHSQSLSQT